MPGGRYLYAQIFKGDKLDFTTAWRDAPEGVGCTSDGSVSCNVDCTLQGDVLVRYLSDADQRVPVFRAAFHTGYHPMDFFRLATHRLQMRVKLLDSACQDPRFCPHFFVDHIFAKMVIHARIKGRRSMDKVQQASSMSRSW
ncbi:hypothetical protein SPRG_15597 [Saprolegnia parasitica CBS 223.65]|uniref:C2 tensin-type domain-containing protein n=1 Tax=Saprolegnia parasitica (strain CBS 223.65) TaxID=695850 RepID=A0A067BTV7_SAPPC|nr:hypothetical protein SPRG_15597 [Saprolegnia parasitica CBS 223.65]KDO17696.1 hypothetical protein SPRG_15597 [Saprolegnia parasitica CBS 223.65]|eukprot:XP_012211594.1 hypothetical protein SPRG_15597 [Saprolegnia parasitica CBS 223.65]